jgi:hypothetical protein
MRDSYWEKNPVRRQSAPPQNDNTYVILSLLGEGSCGRISIYKRLDEGGHMQDSSALPQNEGRESARYAGSLYCLR